MVVSSITGSSSCHLRLDSRTSSAMAARGSLVCMCLETISATSWLVINSHNPSVAITINLSNSGSSSYECSSAFEMTPASLPTVSQRDRLMARPGMSAYESHTRAGPSIPSSYFIANTRPPERIIRARSCSLSGLWSSDRSCAMICSVIVPPLEPLIIRESPTLATKILLSRRTLITAVVPLSVVSTVRSFINSFSTTRRASASTVPVCSS
mmetsp:Transcript_17291/g.30475  ORF Transcript_17291/g.30475 Transcript_17291/m.30475 type:complete len:211 (+) Transcript_17291:79-711(+)